MPSYRDNYEAGYSENRGFFSKILRGISNWGMDTDDMLRNTNAVPINQTPIPVGANRNVDNMYDLAAQNSVAKLLQTKAISYLDRSYLEKQRILREYARKGEIMDYIAMVADEAIMYSEEENFCEPVDLPDEFKKEVKDKYAENFKHIYNKLGFIDGKKAWDYFRALMIDGFLAFEIVFDDRQKNIIGINQLEPSTLLPSIEPTTGDNVWVQFPENPTYRRILLDSQIIYISYSSGAEYAETSYVENLIRPYNQFKLMEQTRIMFNIMNAMVHRVYKIPVAGMSRGQAEEQVAKLIMEFKDEVNFNDEFGMVSMNGSPHIPYNKDIFLTEGESGTPTVEVVSPQGHNLNESDMLTWFFNALKRASKIPFTRFDKTNGGGTVYGDMTEMSRDELHFYQFVQRLRTVFKEIVIKPWKIKMILDFPELEKDENFMTKINVKFNGANLFHEWKQMSNLNKRAELIGNLSNNLKDKDGNSELSLKYLIKRYLGYTDEELAENERYKKMSGVGSADTSGMDTSGGGGGSSPSMDMGMDMGGESGGEPSPVEQAAPTEATPSSTSSTPETTTPPAEDNFDF